MSVLKALRRREKWACAFAAGLKRMGDAAEGLAGGQGYPYIVRESSGPTEAPKWRCMLSSRPKLFCPWPCLSAAPY